MEAFFDREAFLMNLDWFDAKDAIAFGHELAAFIIKSLASPARNRKKDHNGSQHLMKQIATKTAIFKQSHRINFYKKAKLCNTFKWTLIEAGWEKDSANHLTKELLLLL